MQCSRGQICVFRRPLSTTQHQRFSIVRRHLLYQLCGFYTYSKNVTYDSIAVRMRNDVRGKGGTTFSHTGLSAKDV